MAKISNLVVTTLGEEDHDSDDEDTVVEIPLTNVKTDVLAKVVDYCNHYHTEPSEFEVAISLECLFWSLRPNTILGRKTYLKSK